MPERRAGFRFDGQEYEFDGLMLAEARAIQKTTGMTIAQWEDALSAGDANAITALIWIARKRNGEPTLRFDDVDGDIRTFAPLDDDDADTEGNSGAADAAEADADVTAGLIPVEA